MRQTPRRAKGFTLIEVMIAVLIVGILAVLAYPSYQQMVRKGRRSDAMAALNAVQQAQERSRSTFSTYCDEIASVPSATSCGLGLSSQSSSGHYRVYIDGTPTGTSYVVKAEAQGDQAADGGCVTMAVKMERGTLTYGSGSTSAVDWADPNRCWVK